MSKPSKIYQFRYLGSFPPGQTDIDIYEVVTVQKWIIMPFSGWLYKIEVKLEPERISGMLCVTAKKDGIPVETNIVIDGDNPDQFSETYPPEDMYFFPSGSLFNIALISDSQWCVIDAGREERCKVIHVSAEFLVECGTGDWYKEIYGDSQRLLESDSRFQDARAQYVQPCQTCANSVELSLVNGFTHKRCRVLGDISSWMSIQAIRTCEAWTATEKELDYLRGVANPELEEF